MELLLIGAALIVFDLLALRFGADSRRLDERPARVVATRMSYQWLEASVAHHRGVLIQEAEQERLIALARGPRRWAWLPPSRVRLAHVLRAVARVIEPRERTMESDGTGLRELLKQNAV